MTALIKPPVLLVAFAATALVAADKDERKMTPDELKAPSSPAFALVGVTPTKIEKPGSVRAFGAALMTAASGGNNVALQFAPYWWGDRKDLTWEQYESSSIDQVIPQSATFSIITYDKEATSTIAAYNGIGLGFSCELIRGKYNPEIVKRINKIQTDILRRGFDADPTEAELKALKEAALTFDSGRIGSSLNFSSAVAYKYTGTLSDRKEVDRYGGWLTYGYKPTPSSGVLKALTFLGSVRSIHQRALPANQRFTDYGGRLLWRGEQTPVTASIEYMKRTGDARDETVSVAVQYQISDSLYIYLNHGDALKGDGEKNKVMTVAGLNVSWGNAPKVAPK